MTEPLSLDTILSEFSEDVDAWVLQEKTTSLYVTIPHPKYPGRNPIHFFLSESDAKDILVELLDVNNKLKDREIYPVKMKLVPAIRMIATGSNNPLNVDGFVIHSPNEVFEFMQSRR